MRAYLGHHDDDGHKDGDDHQKNEGMGADGEASASPKVLRDAEEPSGYMNQGGFGLGFE